MKSLINNVCWQDLGFLLEKYLQKFEVVFLVEIVSFLHKLVSLKQSQFLIFWTNTTVTKLVEAKWIATVAQYYLLFADS